MNDRGRVGEGVVVGAGDVSLEGEVSRSVTMYAGNADVSGSIGRELTMAGDNLTLTNTARIGGNLSARVRQLKNVHIADGATITGTRDIQVRVRENHFTRPRFYFYQAVWLAAAMLVGWLGLILFPGFFQASTRAVGSGWRSLGLGIASSGGRARGYNLDSHHAGWPSGLAHVARGVSDCDLPGEDLGWSIPGADASEAAGSDEERLAAGTTGGPADPHHRRVHPVSWRSWSTSVWFAWVWERLPGSFIGFRDRQRRPEKGLPRFVRPQARLDDGFMEGTISGLLPYDRQFTDVLSLRASRIPPS